MFKNIEPIFKKSDISYKNLDLKLLLNIQKALAILCLHSHRSTSGRSKVAAAPLDGLCSVCHSFQPFLMPLPSWGCRLPLKITFILLPLLPCHHQKLYNKKWNWRTVFYKPEGEHTSLWKWKTWPHINIKFLVPFSNLYESSFFY